MKHLIYIFLFLLTFGGQAQTKTDPEYAKKLEELYKHTVSLIQPAELAKKLDDKNVYVLDTRAKAEYTTSHIKGARFVDYESFKVSSVKDIPKDAKVIVYCSVGWRSERIGEKLKKAGYTDVNNLYGGIFEWVNQGFTVYNAQGETKTVHAYSKEWAKWIK